MIQNDRAIRPNWETNTFLLSGNSYRIINFDKAYIKCEGIQDPSHRCTCIRTTWRAICDRMSGIEVDITVLRTFQIPSTRGNKDESKGNTKAVPVHAPKASTGNLQSHTH
jgi:hypothetical protein